MFNLINILHYNTKQLHFSAACSSNSTCSVGLGCYYGRCVPPCTAIRCPENSRCTVPADSIEPQCTCLPGYTGDKCESCKTIFNLFFEDR